MTVAPRWLNVWGPGKSLLLAAALLLTLNGFPPGVPRIPALVVSADAAALMGLASYALVRRKKPNVADRVAIAGIGAIILLAVVLPTISEIALRQATQPFRFIHDGALQVEQAAILLEHGKNPYQADFRSTPLVHDALIDGLPNPALDHFVYLPGHLLLTLVLRSAILPVVGFYDDRFLYLLAFAALISIAARLGSTTGERLRSVALVGLNPLLAPFIVEGRSDVLLLAVLLGSVLALYQGRTLLASGLFGAALSIKLFAVFLLPAFLVVLVSRQAEPRFGQRIRALRRALLLALGIPFLVVAPFAAWNPSAFFDDTVRYTAGTASTSYPISGGGLSGNLLRAGIIHSKTDYYPFWIFQLIAVLLALVVLLPWLARRPTIVRYLLAGTLTLLSGTYTGRYFNDNHLGVVLVLAATAWGFSALKPERVLSPVTP